MRLLTWAVLVVLAVTGLVVGRPELGFALAGAKALAVGFEFMELKHAARLHAGVFAFGVLAMAGLLFAIVG